MSVVELGIKRPVTTLMLVSGITIFSFVCIKYIPIELYPNYEFGEVSVISYLRGGIPASEVEKYVTRTMEEVFSGVNGVKEITSASREAESVIVLKFYPDTNLDFAILDIREKLATIRHKLPREMERPIIAKFQQQDVPVVIVTLSSDLFTPEQLREIAEDKIKERFFRISGVANVEIGGGRERKILIEIDNAKLVSYNLPILEVIQRVNLSNISVSAGEVKQLDNRLLIRATGEYKNLDEVRATAVGVTDTGSIIRLGDIAEIKDSYYEPTSFARLNLYSVVSIYIQKETAANTLLVGENIVKEIEKLKKIYPEIIFTVVKNDAEFIKKSITTLAISLIYSAILVGIVLVVFLKSFSSILVVLFTIPVSLSIAIIFIYLTKLSFNIMTLSGLGLGIGMLVDNALIILGNIALKYKKYNTTGSINSYDTTKIVTDATKELVLPIFAATLTTVIVFLPLVFLDPEVRKLYVPFGLAITFSLLASLIGSLVFIPPLVLRLSKKYSFEKPSWEKKLLLYFVSGLKFVFRNPIKVILFTITVLVLGFYILSTRGSEFIETTDINTFRIGVQFPPATRIEHSNNIVKKIEEALMKYPLVERVNSKVEKLHTFIEVKVKRNASYVQEDFRKQFDKFMPAFLYYQPSQQVSSKEVFVDLYGYDYFTLKQLAFLSTGRLSQLKTFTDVKIRMREDEPEIIVNVESDKLGLLNITPLYLANILHGKLRGLVATYYRTGGKEIETICRLPPGSVSTESDLRNLRFVSPARDVIALNQVSNIGKFDTQQEIWHRNKKRFVQISANRQKITLSKAAKYINRELKTLKFPKDCFFKLAGDYEEMIKNQKQFALVIFVTVILIYITLAALFESYHQPCIIMLSVPLGLIGVALLLWLLKKPISLGVWIGFMMLGGIVVNSAIVMVEKMNIYRRKFSCSLMKVVLATPKTYLSEILMTSITTILGVLPLILNPDESAVMWRSLGLTIFGGMLFSTFLVLFLVPLAYFSVEKFTNTIKTKLHHA